MNLKTIELPALPPLAWLAKLRSDSTTIEVFCGSYVEHGDGYVIEGCWSDDFDSSRLLHSQIITGTGLVCANGKTTFVTASDTTQPLYEYRLTDAAVYSNSLPFLMEFARLELLPDYPYYDTDLMSIFLGLRTYRRQIPTTQGGVRVYYHCQIEVAEDLRARVLARPLPPHFPGFRKYFAHLTEQSQALARNAFDSRRKIRYAPLATVSSGYDSPCCAVFARQCGCEEAITFTTAREGFENRDDSGKEIGRRLGLRVQEFEPDAYRQSTALPEVEFIASGYGGDDVIFSAARGVLGKRLLFTGYHGDRVWSAKRAYATDHIVRGDPSGSSLLEFRLATGFQNLPLPFAGCLNHRQIVEIANADEMALWRVGGGYDRPIPRRIVETAGVPRALFGQQKKAASQPYQGMKSTQLPKEFLSEASYESFRKFLQAHAARETLPFKSRRAVTTLCESRFFMSPKVSRLLERLKLDSLRLFKWRHSKRSGEVSLLFHWAVAKQRERYWQALASVQR